MATTTLSLSSYFLWTNFDSFCSNETATTTSASVEVQEDGKEKKDEEISDVPCLQFSLLDSTHTLHRVTRNSNNRGKVTISFTVSELVVCVLRRKGEKGKEKFSQWRKEGRERERERKNFISKQVLRSNSSGTRVCISHSQVNHSLVQSVSQLVGVDPQWLPTPYLLPPLHWLSSSSSSLHFIWPDCCFLSYREKQRQKRVQWVKSHAERKKEENVV